MRPDDHPENDDSLLLGDSDHCKFQMLIGMLNWVVTIGRLDMAYATASLSCFLACPREGHLQRALHVFGYLKQHKNRRIAMYSKQPNFKKCEGKFEKDSQAALKDNYPNVAEEIDKQCPAPCYAELPITAFVDLDHGHDHMTRCSITGLVILVGRTPIVFSSKRQGTVATLTFGAGFCALQTSTEEITAVQYMLRCLGVQVKVPSTVFCNNLGVVQNATIPKSILKKKHMTLAYHAVREAAAAGIIQPIKILGRNNIANVLTKLLPKDLFNCLTNLVFHG